ncbi:long-chain fatty acid--CoA ligase [Alloacidobacterium dinghuense]|uniref:Long-chain-fatty-acid--CoA ligase n=2 Tax=Alloacidobacterium dinghuense TaxID=2763107 RepID=A0A7G8BQW9_9BACT|nr:long-chain fatty acid--CoA ligase [Alloacidobacterium dinghuense]
MLQDNPASIWSALGAANDLSSRFLFGAEADRALGDLAEGSALYGHADELRGRSVLIATTSQLTAALALIELDGVARRVVLYPPDMPLGYLSYVIESAGVDAIVSDGRTGELGNRRVGRFIPCNGEIALCSSDRTAQYRTEWILLTSGTTGLPKLVVHTLLSLSGAIDRRSPETGQVVWSTFYDIRRYGGLQIFLRALLTGASLVLSSAKESTADFLARANSHGITHISGTPSHWRRALMSPAAHRIAPEYVRLSGEIADQAILNHLQCVYPQAQIVHAFATTEAGLAFEVNDGVAGFPASVIENTSHVEMKVEDRTLWIRSTRTASRYMGEDAPILKGRDGFVDTGDMIELRDDRYYFVGRRDGVINVGGLKVHPEEVEAVINRHPAVHMSLVQTKKNPVTGALVVADVVLKTSSQPDDHDGRGLQHDILLLCREVLSPHKVPAAINFVPALAVAESGKLMRRNA